ncbi:hypothetical protein BN1708_000579 [Verticillium longisporum]|uniref:Uncharacterized protein n=1 Tax=Verticillium longisporum TaxID=100787 RepID=A0A0G4LXI9_VERLO|nr:hypothetical protein BN1708_000579 [Verticillium longisporum]
MLQGPLPRNLRPRRRAELRGREFLRTKPVKQAHFAAVGVGNGFPGGLRLGLLLLLLHDEAVLELRHVEIGHLICRALGTQGVQILLKLLAEAVLVDAAGSSLRVDLEAELAASVISDDEGRSGRVVGVLLQVLDGNAASNVVNGDIALAPCA